MTTAQPTPYKIKNKIRIVTAASLFDGHDAAINIMRRIIQASGAEVIHLGHDRSVKEIVDCAIQEDAQAIAITSYQGGHNEFFKYAYDLLKENNCGHIKIFGGGGGTILPSEIEDLHAYGISRIYHPDDGREMGLQGMINDLLEKADFSTLEKEAINELSKLHQKNHRLIGKLITLAENESNEEIEKFKAINDLAVKSKTPVIGITGTGGAGKSSMVDELVRRFTNDFEEDDQKTVAIVSIDPSRRKSGGALLGDRIRMNSLGSERTYMRSMATRAANVSISKNLGQVVNILKAAAFDLIILETSGIGQSGTEIIDHSDVYLYVMTPEYGAASQLEKIDMLDFADIVAINKFDKKGAQDALRDVQKQFKRNQQLWEAKNEDLPIYGTTASQFNDIGTNNLYLGLLKVIKEKMGVAFNSKLNFDKVPQKEQYIIPPSRVRYLSEIVENNKQYDQWVKEQSELAFQLQSLTVAKEFIKQGSEIEIQIEALQSKLDKENLELLKNWEEKVQRYKSEKYIYHIRNKPIEVETHTVSLSNNKIPRVVLPSYKSWGDILKWSLQENVPGTFPYAAGVFPFKRKGEDPTRMFAGEGGPERTNKRFHYLSEGMPAKRLSTAFDSVTLYGNNPDYRPDIFGKIGNSGVSICCLDDAKKLYSGFDLADKSTSVSMTINGPAAIIASFYMNAAVDQQCEQYIYQNGLEEEVKNKMKTLYEDKKAHRPMYNAELPNGSSGLGLLLLGVTGDEVLPREVYEKIKADTLSNVRGTVQADILKEDQAQNTCIFSTDFSLKLMGDMQEYFVENKVRNFYSVSISGLSYCGGWREPNQSTCIYIS